MFDQVLRGFCRIALIGILYLTPPTSVAATEAPPVEPSKEPSHRLLTNYAVAFEILVALEAAPDLVGVSRSIQRRPFYATAYPRVLELPGVGHGAQANVETILGLEPDLVILRGWKEPEMGQRLQELGVNVLPIVVESFEQLRSAVIEIGRRIGRSERAAELTRRIEQNVERVRTATAGIPDDQRPKVYVTGSLGFLSTPSSEMFQSVMVRLAGGEPLGGGEGTGWLTISPEQLLVWNPDHILILPYTPGVTPRDVQTDSRWQSIAAVKSGSVSVFPANLAAWDRPTPVGVLGLLWLAQKLHPERFPEMDFTSEIEDWHRFVFGVGFEESGGRLE